MNLKTVRWTGWMVMGIAVCLMASSCRTPLDTQPETDVKTVTEEYGELLQEPEPLQRMKRIVIPEVSFHPPATIIDAVDFLKQASRDFDDPNIPLEKRGVSFILSLNLKPSAESERVDDPFSGKLSEIYDIPVMPAMKANNISLYDALKLICEATGMKFRIEPRCVRIVPFDDLTTNAKRPLPGSGVYKH